jgi:hypothetical protein
LPLDAHSQAPEIPALQRLAGTDQAVDAATAAWAAGRGSRTGRGPGPDDGQAAAAAGTLPAGPHGAFRCADEGGALLSLLCSAEQGSGFGSAPSAVGLMKRVACAACVDVEARAAEINARVKSRGGLWAPGR